MSKNDNKTNSRSVDFPDDTVISAGANYDFNNPLRIVDPDPDKKYFFAAKDGDKFRPDGVQSCERMGYVKSNKEHCSEDCVLMELPLETWNERQEERKRKQVAKMAAANRHDPAFHKEEPDHGAYKGVKG